MHISFHFLIQNIQIIHDRQKALCEFLGAAK